MAEPAIGSIVETPAGRGLIRFYDAISSSSGKWVGIELNGPTGKGDGTVQGVTYFTCKPNHGMLIRPGQVKVISEPTVGDPTLTIRSPGHSSRPTSPCKAPLNPPPFQDHHAQEVPPANQRPPPANDNR